MALAACESLPRVGDAAIIRHGTVTRVQRVNLADEDAATRGAIVGGAFGIAMTRPTAGAGIRTRNAIIGAAIGAAASSTEPVYGNRYTVITNEGTEVQLVTEQTEIRVDDCVVVEEIQGRANIRRTTQAACTLASDLVMLDEDIIDEFETDASQCNAAKDELLLADDEAELQLAAQKVRILCDS